MNLPIFPRVMFRRMSTAALSSDGWMPPRIAYPGMQLHRTEYTAFNYISQHPNPTISGYPLLNSRSQAATSRNHGSLPSRSFLGNKHLWIRSDALSY